MIEVYLRGSADTPSRLLHLPAGSCAVADIALAREWHAAPAWQRAEMRRARIRANRAPAWLRALFVGEELLRDSLARARVVA